MTIQRLCFALLLPHHSNGLSFSSTVSGGGGGRDGAEAISVGMLTDVHYADRDTAGTRYYRDGLLKVAEAARVFRDRGVTLAFQLGDFTDVAVDVPAKLASIRRIDAVFRECGAECRHLLGNHCLDGLSKEEQLAAVGEPHAVYSFDRGGWHFVVLDACFRADGVPYRRGDFDWTDSNIPHDQLNWLEGDLAAATAPVCVLVHQRLDCEAPMGVRNAPAVREVLERSGKVRAVFQGHEHIGGYSRIGDIHYCTLKGIVEGSSPEANAYAVVDFHPDGTIRIEGFRMQSGSRLD